jgi:Asp-tRNA(Asn)/Glu-tRNA(Gln) amidotransferase B subunit
MNDKRTLEAIDFVLSNFPEERDLGWLIGSVMIYLKGYGNPALVGQIIKDRLGLK